MSINHLPSDLPETLWWAQQHHHHHTMEPSTKSPSSKPNAAAPPTGFWVNSQLYHPIAANNLQNSALNFDLNNEDEDETTIEDERENSGHNIITQEEKEIPKEPLFEKPLTPSDVGKLNRLVIPKQHAEKYFPLSGNDSGGEKGLLLSFEDESGKPWRFRYSYWNSSQSYVLTKGWSRFVKEKRLDAGDIVLFERHRLDGDRLFIGWRRRTSAAGHGQGESGVVGQAQATTVGGGGGGGGGGAGWTRVYFPGGHNLYPPPPQQQQLHHHHNLPDAHGYGHGPHGPHGHGPALPYQPDCLHAAAAAASAVLQNQTTATSANSKRLRLFGVNLECQQQPDEYSESSSEPSSTWSQGQGQGQGQDQDQAQAQYQFQYYPKVHHAYFNHHNHMDINFSRDVNQTRYRQG